MAPFTLDLPDVDPDIEGYCVDVVNTTSSTLLHTEYTNQTAFTYHLAQSNGCHDYSITVTPVNVIGRGQKNTVLYSQGISAPTVVAAMTPILTVNHTTILEYEITMNSPVCRVNLTLTDSFGETIDLDVDVVGLTNIVFTSQYLRTNTLYSGILDVANVNGSAQSRVAISTHDIVGLIISDTPPLTIQAEYVINTEAMGGLFTFMFIGGSGNNVIDFTKSVYIFIDRNTSLNYILPFQLSTGTYYIYAYDIEENGLICNGLVNPASTKFGNYSGNAQAPNQLRSLKIRDCNITILEGQFVSAYCTHTTNSSSAEAGFMMIVQNELNTGQLLVNGTGQDGPTGPITVQVETGNYHVAIFPKTMESGVVHSSLIYSVKLSVGIEVSMKTAATDSTDTVSPITVSTTLIISTVGACFGVLLLVILIAGGILLVLQCRKVNPLKAKMKVEKGKEVPDAAVYAEISDVKESFVYTRNVLYGTALSSVTTSTEYEYIKPDKSQLKDADPHAVLLIAQPQQ